MNLESYLENTAQSVANFAAITGISEQSIYKYMKGDRSPRKKHIQLIFNHTAGKVTANDFYGISKSKKEK